MTHIAPPETLKAISIHAPHAYAICWGIKTEEYRSRSSKQRGWVLIHSSQSKASDKYFTEYGIEKETAKRGAIIGAAYITDCIWDKERECYAYQLETPVLFDNPIEGIKGSLVLFWGAKTEEIRIAFEQAWGNIIKKPQEEMKQEVDDSDAGNNQVEQPEQTILVPGYEIKEIEDPFENWETTCYAVHDSMTKEFLFQIFQTIDGWQSGFTRQTYETPQEVISVSREKTIERLERSLKMEVREIRIQEPDGFGDAYIVRNKESGNHYVVRPDHPEVNSRCECPDALYRGVECKHQLAVKESLEGTTPHWKRQAIETLERILEGEILTIDTAVGAANLSYERDTRFGVNYLCTSRGEGASTKLIMDSEQLEKYIYDLYNPRIIQAFGSANPRFKPPHSPTPNTQLPIPNSQYPTPKIKFVSPDGFYNWEAINGNGETIANLYFCSDELTQPYMVVVNGEVLHQTNTQAKAESYIIWHYKNVNLPKVEEEIIEPCTIEDCDFASERGQQYIFRVNNQMVGYIWFYYDEESNAEYWINGDGNPHADWRECGLNLAKSTRNDLYEEVALLAA